MAITTVNIKEFLNYKQLNNIINSNNTMRSYEAVLMAWLEFISKAKTDEAATEYLTVLADRYSSIQVKNTLYILKSFYDWHSEDINPFGALAKNYRVDKKESHIKKMERDLRVLDLNEIVELKAHAEKTYQAISSNKYPVNYYLAYRNWFIITMMSEYGMRISGLCGVNVNKIDFQNRYMVIYDSKNGEPYPVPIKKSLSALRQYLAVRQSIMGEITKDRNALLLSKTGKRLSDTGARRAINKLADTVDLYDSGRSTHQLRHYRATRYYKDNMPLDLMSAIMGVSVPVLKKTYLHLTDKDTVRQYESWAEKEEAKVGFVCPRCGYGGGETWSNEVDSNVGLRIVK